MVTAAYRKKKTEECFVAYVARRNRRLTVPSPDMIMERREEYQTLREALKSLSYRERDVITLRYGLSGNPPETWKSIAHKWMFGIERARQIGAKAIVKLRRKLKLKGDF